MKTNRDLELRLSVWPLAWPSLKVPAGAAVIKVPGDNGGYALQNPTKYGADKHDATHRYFWVPADAVEGR